MENSSPRPERLPEPQTVSIGTHRISYRSMGEGDPPVVLLHGLGGNMNGWYFNQPELARTRRTIAPDLPGHGGSDRDVGDGSVPELAQRIVAFLDKLATGRIHLVGLSFGGAIALEMTDHIADRIASLTLVDACGLGPEVRLDFINAYLQADDEKAMRSAFAMLSEDESLCSKGMLRYALEARSDPEFRAAVDIIQGAAFPEGRQAYQYEGKLADLPFPVMAIWGKNDRIVPISHANGLPAAVETHLLDGVGHIPNVEVPDRFNRFLLDFLKKVEN